MFNDDAIPEFNYVNTYIDEKELIDLLVVDKDQKINTKLFANLIHDPVDYHEYKIYNGFYIAKNTLREELGFEKKAKPGDFDILIIPFSDTTTFFDRTCAIEVKVVRPTRRKPKRNANSYGEEQIYGLIKDGFPLVGLIHICMTEPLNDHEKITIPYMGEIGEGASTIPLDEREPINIRSDLFSIWSLNIQMKRLISREFPKYVGLQTVGLNISKNGQMHLAFSFDFHSKYEAGYFNPKTSKDTILKIKKYLQEQPDKFIKAYAH